MPTLDPFTLGLGVVQAVPKIFAAISQKRKANKLTVQDNQPAAFKEQLAGLRLGANTARMPGMGAAEGKLAQNFAAGANATARAGGSSADALAGISALSLQRQTGQNQLNVQGQQYQDAAKQRLNQGLSQQAAYQKAAFDDYSRNKANLINSSNQNLNNAISGIAGFGAMAAGNGAAAGGGASPQTFSSDAMFASLPSVPGMNMNPAASGIGLSGYGMTRRKQRGAGVF